MSQVEMDLEVSVSVRIRPGSSLPSSSRSTVPIQVPWSGTYGQFEVDRVHEEEETQNDVYVGSVLPAVNSFLQVCDLPCMARTARSAPMIMASLFSDFIYSCEGP